MAEKKNKRTLTFQIIRKRNIKLFQNMPHSCIVNTQSGDDNCIVCRHKQCVDDKFFNIDFHDDVHFQTSNCAFLAHVTIDDMSHFAFFAFRNDTQCGDHNCIVCETQRMR